MMQIDRRCFLAAAESGFGVALSQKSAFYDDIGALRGRVIRTPNLDRMAREGPRDRLRKGFVWV
ncbi:hypothetical protein [Consotaella aegiceratis]|uniref:hypothetical protein n=1 Tax=Consotaella aegiceratis TaxID=3097961 RepID=UPI002F3F15E2